MLKYNRVPMIQDERKPWTYRGWLAHDLFEGSAVLSRKVSLDSESRWEYWQRTMLAEKILDDPIPRNEFETYPSERQEGFKMIDQCVRIVDATEGGWSSVGNSWNGSASAWLNPRKRRASITSARPSSSTVAQRALSETTDVARAASR